MTDHPYLDHSHLGHSAEIPSGLHDPHAGPHEWDQLYSDQPEWDIGRPQRPFVTLAEDGALRGRVLDVGCGTGEHVLMCAGIGLDATGIDIAATAIQAAEHKARERGLTARFLRHDARRLADLGESFDAVLDCGLFVHVVDDEHDLAAYLEGLRTVLPVGGRYFMACFRGQQTHHRGLTRDQVAAVFADGWRLDSFEPTTLLGAGGGAGTPASLATLTRI